MRLPFAQPDESTRGVGRRGERAAARAMRRRGCTVVARNLELGIGEIDLLCVERRSGTLVVVEVKARITRGGDEARRPEDNITAAKKRKLRTLTTALVSRDPYKGRPVRIDVVGVEFAPGRRRPVRVRVFEGAV